MKTKIFCCSLVALTFLTSACLSFGRVTDDSSSIPAPSAGDLPPQERAGMLFSGSIYGDKSPANFEMTLRREGGSLSGSYYYLRSGSANKLTLKGTIAADGSFTMEEFDAAGKQTGEFTGKWKEDSNDAGVSLEGEWRKPGAKDPLSWSADQQMIFFTSPAHFSTLEMKDTIAAKKADLSAQYPQLTGPASAAGFNLAVKNRVARSFADFRKMMAEFTAADFKGTPADMRNYLDVGYSVEYADDDLVSLSFGEDTFAGGAHPNHTYFTITYDLKQGKQLSLADLFKPGSRYLQAIADHCARDLRARKDPDTGENLGLADDMWADGVKPTTDNFRNWNITNKGLLILFPPYQVAAYAYGPQQVIVPYSQLKDIARPDSPMAKLMQ